MAYSRRRLLALGVAFLVLGTAFLVVAPDSHYLSNSEAYEVPNSDQIGVVSADEHNCDKSADTGNDVPPCMFPAESGSGGIILGASRLTGSSLSTWLSVEGGINDGQTCYEDADRTCIYRKTGPGRVVDQEPVAAIGLNGLTVQDFYAYKSWTATTADGQDFYTSFWMAAEEAQLNGRDSTQECRGIGSSGNHHLEWGRKTCDLVAEAGETAIKDFWAFAQATLNVELNGQDYWLSEPERDQCDVDIWDTSATCLGMLEAGSGGQSKLDDTNAAFANFALRVYRASAIPSPSSIDNPPVSKELVLKDVYIEQRYGKNTDSAYVPRNESWPRNMVPILRNGQGSAQHRRSRMQFNFPCDGNPFGTGYQSCFMSSGQTQVGVNGTMYEDIHRP